MFAVEPYTDSELYFCSPVSPVDLNAIASTHQGLLVFRCVANEIGLGQSQFCGEVGVHFQCFCEDEMFSGGEDDLLELVGDVNQFWPLL